MADGRSRLQKQNARLIDLAALINKAPAPYEQEWFKRVDIAVRDYMNSKNDSSYDYEHAHMHCVSSSTPSVST